MAKKTESVLDFWLLSRVRFFMVWLVVTAALVVVGLKLAIAPTMVVVFLSAIWLVWVGIAFFVAMFVYAIFVAIASLF